VALICGAIAFVPWLLEPTPAKASRSAAYEAPSQLPHDETVRVIVPFAPNTTPSQR
jgi:hypothetical protein